METENNGTKTGRDSLGRFGQGNPGKPKGARNKLREKLKAFIELNLEDLQAYFDELDNRDKVKVLTDLLPFVIAKLQGVSTVDTEGNDLQQTPQIDYSALSENTMKEILQNTYIQKDDENQSTDFSR